MIALKREPSDIRASTIGVVSSTRRPTAADDALDDLHQVLVVLVKTTFVLTSFALALDEHGSSDR